MPTSPYPAIHRKQSRCCNILWIAAASIGLTNIASAATRTHDYTVQMDAALAAMQVDVRFSGAVRHIAARSRSAGRYARDFRACDGTVLQRRGRRLQLPTAGITCLSYRVDVQEAVPRQRRNRALATDNFVLSPAIWLWRPALDGDTQLDIDFVLPDGIKVATPWRELDDSGRRFRVTRSPESANAPVAFGNFLKHNVSVPGATLRVSLLHGQRPMDEAGILRWVEAAATDVSLAYGLFPNPSPLVVVIPATDRNRSSAVPFGRVIRDGGETVELFINPARPLSSFLADWTATHEFSHLLLPYLDRRDRWISEGFAQYYQNVLLARSGTYDRRRAWQKLYAGLERGRRSRPDLSPGEAAANRASGSTMKVYWAGAALALQADVLLREMSRGRKSLDSVLRQLQDCCLPSDRSWSGMQLFVRLDEIAGLEVFVPLYRRYANTPGFPDTSDVFERLGLVIDNGRVRLAPDADLAAVRDSIMEVDPATARWRQQLAFADD